MPGIEIETPYDLVYSALWRMVQVDPDFPRIVKAANIMRFDGKPAPMKDEVSNADFPFLALIPQSTTPLTISASNMVGETVTWAFQWGSGDMRLNFGYFAVKWIVTRCIFRERHGVRSLDALRDLVFQGVKIVVNVKPLQISEGINTFQPNKSIVGWTAVGAIETQLCYPKSIL